MSGFSEFTQKPWWSYVCRIPGWCSELELSTLARLASQVSGHGAIIEVGGFAGRSAAVFGYSAPDASVISIDPWNYNEMLGSIEAFIGELRRNEHLDGDKSMLRGVTDFFRFFIRNTAACGNVRGIKGTSQSEHLIVEGADIVYLDGDHSEQGVLSDLRKWSLSIRHGGLLIGHDYAETGVQSALRIFLSEAEPNDQCPKIHVL